MTYVFLSQYPTVKGGEIMSKEEKGIHSVMTDNLKKGVTEMMVLAFLDKNDMHINAIVKQLEEYSGGVYSVAFPYAAIYRLTENGYIYDCGKKVEDNRLRHFYRISDSGRKYYKLIREDYEKFISGVTEVFKILDK